MIARIDAVFAKVLVQHRAHVGIGFHTDEKEGHRVQLLQGKSGVHQWPAKMSPQRYRGVAILCGADGHKR